MGRALMATMMVAGALVASVGAAQQQPVCIDDLTCQDGAKTIAPALPPAPMVQPGPVARPAVHRPFGAGDGYAACQGGIIYPFDLVTYEVGPPIELPGANHYPYDAGIRPDNTEIWIADASADAAFGIDRATDTVPYSPAVGDYPVGLAFSKDESFAIVSCRDNDAGIDNMYLISTATHTVTSSWVGPKDGSGPGHIALDPVSGRFYMVQWYGSRLYELQPSGDVVRSTVPLGSSLWNLVVDPDGSLIYVTDRSTDQVRVIDRATLTEITTVAVGDDPWGIAITPNGKKLYVACEDSANVISIDTGTWTTTTIPIAGSNPDDIDISPDGSMVYVAGGDSGTTDYVYVIEVASDTLVGSIPIPSCGKVYLVATAPQLVPVELQRFSLE